MGGNKILGGFRKAVDPWGLTGGENIFGGNLYKGRPFGKNAGAGIRKIVDPLGLTGGENIFGGRTYGRPQGSGYYKPYDFKAMQGMMQNNTSNQMMGDILNQKAMADQAQSQLKAENLQAANAQQQQNINAAMQNSKQNLNNSLMRTPVPSTFSTITPASTNQFKLPNVAGLTFGK